MSEFIRIKQYIINMESITYIRTDDYCIDFGFSFPVGTTGGQTYIRFERDKDLKDSEFNEVREFVLNLPDPDRVIVI